MRMRGLRRVPDVLIGALLALLVGGVAGCGAARQYFEPTERVTGQTENGYSQALYPLSGPRGPFGEATLWSRGAYKVDSGSAPALRGGATIDDRTVVQIAFSLHNTSDAPIELRGDELRIGTMRTDDALLSELVPADPSVLSVPPQAIGEAQFHFVLPPDTQPREVRAFRVRWAVHAKHGVYRQRTVFIELHPRDDYYPPPYAAGYPCWPYGPYDCLYGPPFGAYPTPYPVGYPRYPSIRSERTSVHPNK
jgi:hypothetical protein